MDLSDEYFDAAAFGKPADLYCFAPEAARGFYERSGRASHTTKVDMNEPDNLPAIFQATLTASFNASSC